MLTLKWSLGCFYFFVLLGNEREKGKVFQFGKLHTPIKKKKKKKDISPE